MKAAVAFSCVASLVLSSLGFAGTTGKITGTVTDANKGDKLIGANVLLQGTTLGATTNVDGDYVILNVPPGSYEVRASLVGYSPVTTVDVRVSIDQTTNLDFRLTEEALQGEEVVVVAQRPVIQKDVAASRANIEIEDVLKLPVATVTGAVGLQAGVEGLSIRGGLSRETAFMLDGQALRDERTNAPYTAISLLSIQDVQVQTGGFSAEYGNLRSGVINVVTKEGSKSNYQIAFIGRYAPARPKHFGPSIYDRNSYWMRPYLEDPIAWYGTEAIDPATGQPYWDQWTRAQYPAFEGWNSVAVKNLSTYGLTPAALQQLFLFQRRKQAEITKSDYDIDASVSGPVPLVGEYLGNLRFFGAYRQSRDMYLIPLSEDSYRDYNGQLKLTADVSNSMKLTIEGLIGKNKGTNDNNAGLPGIFRTNYSITRVMDRVSYIDTRIFATDYWAPTSTDYKMLGAKFSHVVNATTFYDANISVFSSEYNTNPGRERDTSKIYRFGDGYFADESPFGFTLRPVPANGLADIRFGVGFSNSRDTSKVVVYTGKFDITSQLDKYNQIKAGVELVYTDNSVRYGLYDAFLPDRVFNTSWHSFPIKGALFARDKIEFEGMIADLGVRVDYLDPGGDWYVFRPFDPAFSGANAPGIDTILAKVRTERQLLLSPRVGIAFPISEDAKLFFNYGHFRQQPQPENMFLLQRQSFDNSISRVADPNAPLPKTVAYELGYEHSLFDEYLLRVAAYYKDITNETRTVSYVGKSVDYLVYTSNGYRDIRGAEITLSKNRGNWIQGFINYTYDVRTAGYFGLNEYDQNIQDQAANVAKNIYQEKPIPQPYARVNIDFFTPAQFGPEVAGIMPLADWRVNIVGSWINGEYFTWTGGASIPGVSYNVQWTDYYRVDMRISKNFTLGPMNLQLFADITNLFNTKFMGTRPITSGLAAGFVNTPDYNSYMMSLHLPEFSADVKQKIGYINIPGEDRPGDYRKDGVPFQPIVAVGTYGDLLNPQNQQTRPFYYVSDLKQYYQYVNGAWQVVDQSRLDQVLEDKAYIDMPNQSTFTFLNPRQIFFGLRFSLDI